MDYVSSDLLIGLLVAALLIVMFLRRPTQSQALAVVALIRGPVRMRNGPLRLEEEPNE